MADDDGRILPFRPTVRTSDLDPRVVGLVDSAGNQLFDALSSETAREILAQLHEEPATPSELASALDCSRQVVHYHLDTLLSTELIRAADTGYSEKGVEMTIYAPVADPLVIKHEPTDAERRRWQQAPKLLGGAAVVAIGALVTYFMTRPVTQPLVGSGPPESDGSAPPSQPVPASTEATATPNGTVSSTPMSEITSVALSSDMLVALIALLGCLFAGWWLIQHGVLER
ncbi:ArsR/SmtB family transcription factor [Halocatena halophila]|uniref:ArsR/SmtB family transcription factor n=1 Tax=Halocatena halophila TaxID=2814576 RepID=UPI002ECFFE55